MPNRFMTFFNHKTNTWSGGKSKRFYNNDLSFGQIAFEHMRRRPHKICQICDSEGTQLTNEEVLMQAIKIVKFFESEGIRQSDIIGIVARNTTYLFGVVLACFFHGCAYHAVNPGLDKLTTRKCLEISKPKLVFCDGQDYEKIEFAVRNFDTAIITLSNHFKEVDSIYDILSAVPSSDCDEFEPADLESGSDQNLAILCTSGSTATPKAVTIPNRMRIYEMNDFLTEDDIQFVPSTVDWITALGSITASIIYGALRIITHKALTADYCLDLFEKYGVTFTMVAPSYLALIVNSPKATQKALASMRYFVFAGSPCTMVVQNRMQSLLNNGKLITGYGFSEIRDFLTKNFFLHRKPKSVGVLAPEYKVRIIDDSGNHLGPGETGEILVKSSQKWLGYYKNPEATASILDENGWYHSGDLGYFDDDGYLFIAGRKKEMLKFRGIQYYPSDIEEVIANMPEVKEVCVFGVFDEFVGDSATAAVVPIDGAKLKAEEVIDFVRSNVEVEYKQLHGGAIILKELLKTGSGKIDRNANKQLFLRLSNKQEMN